MEIIIPRLLKGVLGLAGASPEEYKEILNNQNHWLYKKVEQYVLKKKEYIIEFENYEYNLK